jgi:hypothetical protein
VFINHNGRRKAKKVGSQEAAKTVAKKIEARLVLGESFLPEKQPTLPTLNEYYKKFLHSLSGNLIKAPRAQFWQQVDPEIAFVP